MSKVAVEGPLQKNACRDLLVCICRVHVGSAILKEYKRERAETSTAASEAAPSGSQPRDSGIDPQSDEGQKYMNRHRVATDFAHRNRALLACRVAEVLKAYDSRGYTDPTLNEAVSTGQATPASAVGNACVDGQRIGHEADVSEDEAEADDATESFADIILQSLRPVVNIHHNFVEPYVLSGLTVLPRISISTQRQVLPASVWPHAARSESSLTANYTSVWPWLADHEQSIQGC